MRIDEVFLVLLSICAGHVLANSESESLSAQVSASLRGATVSTDGCTAAKIVCFGQCCNPCCAGTVCKYTGGNNLYYCG